MKRFLSLFISILLALSCPFCVSAEPSVSAKGAVLINAKTGYVLFEKNAHTVLPMASTTKIMTALLLCEAGDLDREIIITDEMVRVEGSSMGLRAGMTVTRRDLLYGMLLASGNDAANAAACSVSGSVSAFISLMNRKAKSLGLKNTHFATPSGLDAEGHYTTAYDLAILASRAIENPDFLEACSSKSATLYFGDPPAEHTVTNHNRLLKSYEGLIGVKTGFTKKSGRCLVTAAKRDGAVIVAVTLNAPSDWNDHRQMLDYGFSVLNEVNLSELIGEKTLSVVGGREDKVACRIEPASVWLHKNEIASVVSSVELESFVYAPVKKGQSVGNIKFLSNEKLLACCELKAAANVEVKYLEQKESRNYIKYLISLFKGL